MLQYWTISVKPSIFNEIHQDTMGKTGPAYLACEGVELGVARQQAHWRAPRHGRHQQGGQQPEVNIYGGFGRGAYM